MTEAELLRLGESTSTAVSTLNLAESVDLVGVPRDPELPAMVGVMVVGTQTDELARVGLAIVTPVDDVVELEVTGRGGAAGEPAALVAGFDQAAGPPGHDASCPTDIDRVTLGLPDRLDDAVTGEPVDHVLGQSPAGWEMPALAGVALAVVACWVLAHQSEH